LRTFLFALALLAAAAAMPVSASADSHTLGFQLQADGVLSTPMGQLASLGNTDLSDLYGSGNGFAITATMGMTRHWFVGLRVASFRGTKNSPVSFTDLPAQPGQALAPGAGPFTQEHFLRLLPIHALLQYRHGLGKSVEFIADAGAGLMSSSDVMSLMSEQGHGQLASIPGYQHDPSWTAGLALGVHATKDWDVIAGGRYTSIVAGDGAVWASGDAPGFANWTLGVRYPHDTH